MITAQNLTADSTSTDWTCLTFVGFDTETTGIFTETTAVEDMPRIVTASAYCASNGHVQDFLLNPGIDIPDEAAAVHGITTEYAQAHGVDAAEGVKAIADLLAKVWAFGAVLVGQNIAYDLTVLNAEMIRYGYGPLVIAGPVLDTLVVDKHIDKYRKGKRTLDLMSAHYGVELTNAHSADADAEAACKIGQVIAERHLGAYTPAELHDAQVIWAANQAASLQEYFRRTRPDAVVDGTWPVRSGI